MNLVASLKSLLLTGFILIVLPVKAVIANDFAKVSKKVMQQLQQAEQKSIKNPEQAIAFLEDLLASSEHLNKLEVSKLKIALASNYILIGQLSDSELLYQDLSEVYQSLPISDQIDYLVGRSLAYGTAGKQEQAEKLLQQAELLALELGDDAKLSDVYGYFANHYLYIHEDIKAIKFFSKAYDAIKRTDDRLKVAYIESGMAQTYEALFDYERAIDLSLRSLAYFDEQKLVFDSQVMRYHLARVYRKLGNYTKALELVEQMLANQSQLSGPQFQYYNYFSAAEIHYYLGNTALARHYLDLSEPLFTSIEDMGNRALHYYIAAGIAIEEQQFESAQQFLENAFTASQKSELENSFETQLMHQSLVAELAAKQGDFATAYTQLMQYITINEQHNKDVRETARSRHKVIFDMQQVALENEILEKDQELNELVLLEAKRKQQFQQFIIISILLLFAAVLIFTWRQYQLKRKFIALANTDPLTQVANRRQLMTVAEQSWEQQQPLSLISFDLDHFKKVNDQYGHPAGDKVLQEVCLLAKSLLREQDVLGRIGGEEFMIVLIDSQLQQALDVANRLKDAINAATVVADEQKIKVTASFGVVQKQQQQTFKDMLKAADKALYLAKERGRNRVETNE